LFIKVFINKTNVLIPQT